MEIPDRLLCFYSAQVKEQDGAHVIEVPAQELAIGDIREGGTYRVAVLSSRTDSNAKPEDGGTERERGPEEPPVEYGERRDVEIEDIGDQGDGIARVERGYVVIVPEAEQGERVTVEITEVKQNVAFAEIVDRQEYFE